MADLEDQLRAYGRQLEEHVADSADTAEGSAAVANPTGNASRRRGDRRGFWSRPPPPPSW